MKKTAREPKRRKAEAPAEKRPPQAGKDGPLPIEVRMVPLARLKPDPENARVHDERNLEEIVASYLRFGQQKPIVVSKDLVVFAGNGQLEAARRLGWKRINCTVSRLTAREIRAYALGDNRTSDLSSFEMRALARSVRELAASPEGMAGTGFSEDEARAIAQLDAPPAAGDGGDDIDEKALSDSLKHTCPKCGARF